VTGRLAQGAGKYLHWLGCSKPTDAPTNGLPPQRTAGNIAPRLQWRHRPTEIYGPLRGGLERHGPLVCPLWNPHKPNYSYEGGVPPSADEGCSRSHDNAPPPPQPPEMSSTRGTPCVARCRSVLWRKSKLAVDFGRKEASFPLWCQVSSKRPGNSFLRESILRCVEGTLCLKARKDYFQAPSFLCLE
jgi:hypothetical protein